MMVTYMPHSSATLAALLRGALQKKLDFSRIIILRAASNFDQPPEGEPVESRLTFPPLNYVLIRQ